MSNKQPKAPPLVLTPANLGDGKPPPYPPGPGYPPQDEDMYPLAADYPQPMESFPLEDYPQPGGYPEPGGHPGPPPMTNQPKAGMDFPPPYSKLPGGNGSVKPVPTGIPVCPLGLQYLTMINELMVHQVVEQLGGGEIKNNFTINNSVGQKIYTTEDETGSCTRCCCENERPFEMKIKDNDGNEVIRFVRDLACDSCCCPCCLQTLEVMSPSGIPVGRVVQEWGILTDKFRVENEAGETVFKITDKSCTFTIGGNMEFEVFLSDGAKVGKITRGQYREAFTVAKYFGITFPGHLDVKLKATLLGALFLIDYMFFEKKVHGDNACCYCLGCLCEVMIRM